MTPYIRLFFTHLLLTATTALSDQKPNILLIMADDLGIEGLGCYGGLSYRTPHLDQMAEEGLRFTHAYSQPLCTPTRVQIMTGKYNHRNWTFFGILDPKEKTFGHHLQAAGYTTGIFGKWQLYSYDPPDLPNAEIRRGKGMHPKDAGFDEYALFHALHTEDKGSRFANPTMLENGQLKHYAGEYGEDIWVTKIVDFMERHRNQPAFVYYPMALPHRPFEPTPDTPGWDPENIPDEDIKYIKPMVEYMDTLIGRLLDKLQARSLDKDTLVLFYSDNGFHNKVVTQLKDGRRIRGGKAKATQSAIHVPLIALWPGTIKPSVCHDLVDASDFLPTLLELAGAQPITSDGISFAPQITGEPTKPREDIFVWYDPRPGWDKERFDRQVFALNKTHKLFRNGRLYRLTHRPLEEIAVDPLAMTSTDIEARAVLQKVIETQLNGVKEPPLVDAYGKSQHDLLHVPANKDETRKITLDILKTGKEMVYGDPDISEQRLWIFNPLDLQEDEQRPCVIFIHGGGWGGKPESLAPQAEYIRRLGLNAVSIHFRPPSKAKGVTPADTLKDARQAYRWIIKNGHKHGIDSERLVVSGGSAGGHLSLALSTIALEDDPVISQRPLGYVLFNPAIDLVDGWAGGRTRAEAAGIDAMAFSPAHHVVTGLPPTLILSGSEDQIITPAQIEAFQKRMRAKGNTCQFIEYPGADHAFFNYGRENNQYFHWTMWAFEDFLKSIDLLP